MTLFMGRREYLLLNCALVWSGLLIISCECFFLQIQFRRLPKDTTIDEAKQVSLHGCCKCIYPISSTIFFSNPFSLLVQAKLRMPMDLEGKVPVTCKLERHQFSFEDWGNKQLLCITDVPKKKTIYKLSEQGSVNYRKNLRQARFSTQQVNCTNHHTKVRKVLRTDFGVYYATFSFTSH